MKYTGLSWLLGKLSYAQIYFLIFLCFTLSLLPLCYFWIHNHLIRNKITETRIQELSQTNNIRLILEKVQTHRLLTAHYLSGDVNSREKLQEIENQADEAFLKALEKEKDLFSPSTLTESQLLNLNEVYKNWQSIKVNDLNISVDQSTQLHDTLIRNLLGYFNYFNNEPEFYNHEAKDTYFWIENILLRLVILQENISQLNVTLDQIVRKKQLTESERDKFVTARSLISDRILLLSQQLKVIPPSFNQKDDLSFIALINQYMQNSEEFITLVQNKLINGQLGQLSLTELNEQQESIRQLGYRIWDQGTRILTATLETEYEEARFELWFVLFASLVLAILAFLAGLFATSALTKRLFQLTQATNNFSNGDFSVRVPVLYQDQVGTLGNAFNHMAQTLEDLLNRVYQALDSTKTLAEGNLSARMPLKGDNSDFDQLAQSFNQMAQTFETMMGRIKHLGISLTSSATEIASASKEQEVIIVEQEATTREIAIAANEISSTAKEFANTMNDISQVADQTSHLALTGKDSLTNMEGIMRQMVDASSNIAAKLAILNEKATNITSVITTITKVADQTNLLSLNASIEAEKAGEYGRSFAVIAREIRRLADQTAVATLDIEKIVNEIMTAISSSVMGVDDFTQEIREGVNQVGTVSGQLAKIIEQVQAFTARFELVNQGMQAQSTGAEQINEAIAQLSQTAQQTSESIHHFHRTIQELNSAANELRTFAPFIPPRPSSEQNIFNRRKPGTSSEITQINKALTGVNTATDKLKTLNINLKSYISKEGPF